MLGKRTIFYKEAIRNLLEQDTSTDRLTLHELFEKTIVMELDRKRRGGHDRMQK
jgi:hypothetical protein